MLMIYIITQGKKTSENYETFGKFVFDLYDIENIKCTVSVKENFNTVSEMAFFQKNI